MTQDIVASYDNDEEVKDIFQKLCIDRTEVLKFVNHNGMLRYKGLIYVGKSAEIQGSRCIKHYIIAY